MYTSSFSPAYSVSGLNTIRLFRRYKQEQLEEIQEERERLEAERIKSEKLMQELLELKQQLLEKQNTGDASSASDKS